jgi:hypothetical protein
MSTKERGVRRYGEVYEYESVRSKARAKGIYIHAKARATAPSSRQTASLTTSAVKLGCAIGAVAAKVMRG